VGSEVPATHNAAGELLRVSSVYSRCRTYQDRGTVVVKTWSRNGEPFTFVNRFDTIFVRDRGLRFRYFEEDGTLNTAIWKLDGRAGKVWFGTARELDASKVESEMFALRGVTEFASWFVPSLLLGRAMPLGDGPSYAGSTCLWCMDVAFRSSKQEVRRDLSLDLHANVVRRLYEEDTQPRRVDNKYVSGPTPPPIVRTETMILYDTPSFDSDEGALIAEIQKES
jgi:hypothetical protein